MRAIFDAGGGTHVAYLADCSPAQRQESLEFEFFSTMGTFTPPTAGRAGTALIQDGGGIDGGRVDGGPDSGPEDASRWASDPPTGSQTVTFWEVVYDGRGGVGWLERTAQYSR